MSLLRSMMTKQWGTERVRETDWMTDSFIHLLTDSQIKNNSHDQTMGVLRDWERLTGSFIHLLTDSQIENNSDDQTMGGIERLRETDWMIGSFIHLLTVSLIDSLSGRWNDWLIKLYFWTVKRLAQRPTDISAVATVLLLIRTFTVKIYCDPTFQNKSQGYF